MPLAWMPWLPVMFSLAFGAMSLGVLLRGQGVGPAAAFLVLAMGFAALSAWVFRLQPVARERPGLLSLHPPTRTAVESPPAPRAAGQRVERRRHPRVAVDWKVEIAWHHAGRQPTRLHDLSRGGARLIHREPEPAGRRGLLLVPGLNLPVPFTVVEARPETGLHIRFDLEGMGLDALEQQLDALIARGAAGG